LIGDGRELTGSEQTLSFDSATGAWTLTEPEPDGPKTPERAEILNLLKASETPMTPKQIAEALDKNVKTTHVLLTRMVRDGDIKLVGHGKYIPVGNVRFVGNGGSVHTQRDGEEYTTTIVEKNEGTSPFSNPTNPTNPTPVPASAPEPDAASDPEPDAASEIEATAEAILAASPDAPPADFLRFVHSVADITHSRVDPASIRRVPGAPEPASIWPFLR
jgi:hypothetical protein